MAFKKYHQISPIWTNCCFIYIVEQITVKKVGITVVGLYPRTLYKLYLGPTSLYKYICSISGHCASEYYDI